MHSKKLYSNLLFDFDGVIIDSAAIRIEGFKFILKSFPETEVKKLLEFHEQNGGLSRYVKINYFFKEIRNEIVSDQSILEYAEKFSEIMRIKLTNKAYLIKDACDFIQKHHQHYNFHIVSGSDENELKYLCKHLDLFNYFKSIHGSPTAKNDLVRELMKENNYDKEASVLIGDSMNDYEAAFQNNISFRGYNNSALRKIDHYLDSFSELEPMLSSYK